MSVCEKITKEYEKTFLGVIRYGDIGNSPKSKIYKKKGKKKG